jgi:hypothetical protein
MTIVEDKIAIGELLQGWMHRDLGRWDKLRDLFHPDGAIEVTWFGGLFGDFVDGSMRMGHSDIRTKHVIGSPLIAFNGDRAIAETNVIIVCDNPAMQLGCESHGRFYDMIECRDGAWKILKRRCIYDMGYFTYPAGPTPIDEQAVSRFPREYGALAYMLEKSGFPVARPFPVRGGTMEAAIKAEAGTWLDSGA